MKDVTGAPITGIVKEGSCKDIHFILIVPMVDGTHIELPVQDHTSSAKPFEGKDVSIIADTIDGVMVCRSIEEALDGGFDADGTVTFSAKLSTKRGGQRVEHAVSIGRVDPSNPRDIERILNMTREIMGLRNIDSERVIAADGNERGKVVGEDK